MPGAHELECYMGIGKIVRIGNFTYRPYKKNRECNNNHTERGVSKVIFGVEKAGGF